eukprot:TRINITY_DN3581_c0_g1_i1.p1 TRINITY_DN3581_c0_g1~~TRINITY_DN3581_c0_g1_i1.p1  ORF type:complete len:545 (+),score=63.38 TRINITY_DN3581_c0_g1_i1:897-2531(+)
MTEEQKNAPGSEYADDKEIVVLSTEKGTLADEKETNILKSILKTEFKLEETPESEALLREVLAKLRNLIKDWVRQTAIKKKESLEVVEKAGGELYISGSFRLGVHGSTSDIDALCVVPRFVDREIHFFGDLYESLKKNKEVKDLRGIKEAHVPIIKMKILDVDIDLLFARLSYETIGDNLSLRDDNVLKGCDDKTISSLNACRNNDLIIELVPNKETFKITLKCIKVWAKSRDLYSNKMGYLGGISWAILVAKTCQLYPYLPPNKLLEKLFFTFYRWKWKIPVLLCELREPKGTNLPSTLPKNWNPKLVEQGDQHLMPIITPAYPCINSTYNVSNTTRRILLKELQRAAKITRKINRHIPGYSWMSLFKKYDFFKEYFHYLRVDVLSQTPEDHLMWEGLVESRLRVLITHIEASGKGAEQLRPYTKPFNLLDHEYKHCTTFLIGFKLKAVDTTGKIETDLREPLCYFCENLMWTKYSPEKTWNLRITHVTRDKLPNEVFENGIRPHYPKKTEHEPEKEEINELFKGELDRNGNAWPRKKGKYEQ